MPQASDAAHQSADTLLTEAQVADLLSLKPTTLQAYRARGTGPRFYKLPSIRYGRADVDAWLNARLVRPSDEEVQA